MPGKMLIIGGTGLLGMDLARYFSKEYDVYPVGSVDFDIKEFDQVKAFVGDISPDIVLHAAAIADVDFCEKEKEIAQAVNSLGTKNIAKACRECNSLLIYYSTDYVFDGKKGAPYIETDHTGPINHYGRTKLEGEKHVESILDKYAILRIAWLYANHKRAFVNKLIGKGRAQLEKKEKGRSVSPEKIVSDQIGSPTFAPDIARQTEVLIKNNLKGLFHCVAGGETSRYDLAEYIFREMSMPVDIIPCSIDEFDWLAPRPKYTALENKRLNELKCCIMPDYKMAVKAYLKEFEKE